MAFSIKNIRKKISEFVLGDIKEVGINEKSAGSSSGQITNSNLKNFIIKHVGWDSDSDDFSGAESDLSEVKSAIETDSYIKVALDKTAQLVLKSGYRFESSNPQALEYLKARLSMMEFGSGIPFNVLLTETARNLVYYSNCFWVKSRIDKIQGGLQAKPVLGKKPVGAYFIMDPTSVEIKRDSNGTLSKYKLTGSEEKEFAANDCVHFYIDRDANNNFGTPRIISVMEDVKILRKIEGHTLSLIYRFAIPLYQMKIGLPETNLMATNQEISEAEKQINKMPLDGIIVTNERTNFYAIGSDGKAIDLSVYLDYFEKRVFTGLNVSEAMMGRGGSKQDADSMEGLMHDSVKFYQAAITSFIEQFVFNEILLEGGFNPIFNEEDKVYFIFNEINIDTKIKQENHILNQYQNNSITFEEMRQNISRSTEVDESRLYANMITTPNEIEIIKAKVSASNATGNGNQANGKTASTAANGTSKSIVSPSNQHGTSSAKMKENNEEWHVNPIVENQVAKNLQKSPQKNQPNPVSNALRFYDKGRRDRILTFRLEHPGMYKTYINMRNNISNAGNFSPELEEEFTASMNAEFDSVLNEYSRIGYKNSQLSAIGINIIPDKIEVPKELLEQKDRHIKNLIGEIKQAFEGSRDRNIVDCFDFCEYKLRFACDYLSRKAYNYAIIKGYQKQGIKKVKLKLSDGDSDKNPVIDTDNFKIEQIPPYHSNCSCEIIQPEVQTQWL